MKLRRSQIEVLKAVEVPGASAAGVGRLLGRSERGVEASLEKLEHLGLVEPVHHPLVCVTYRLTEAGKQALSEEGKR